MKKINWLVNGMSLEASCISLSMTVHAVPRGHGTWRCTKCRDCVKELWFY